MDESRLRALWLCALVTVIIGAAGFAFDRMLIREGIRRTDILILSNGLTGVVGGALFYELSRIMRERREITQQRLRTIAEMNHHIRNALQVISYAAISDRHEDSIELISRSVERIEWSLREVLPGYAPGESKEASEQPAREPHPAGKHAGK